MDPPDDANRFIYAISDDQNIGEPEFPGWLYNTMEGLRPGWLIKFRIILLSHTQAPRTAHAIVGFDSERDRMEVSRVLGLRTNLGFTSGPLTHYINLARSVYGRVAPGLGNGVVGRLESATPSQSFGSSSTSGATSQSSSYHTPSTSTDAPVAQSSWPSRLHTIFGRSDPSSLPHALNYHDHRPSSSRSRYESDWLSEEFLNSTSGPSAPGAPHATSEEPIQDAPPPEGPPQGLPEDHTHPNDHAQANLHLSTQRRTQRQRNRHARALAGMGQPPAHGSSTGIQYPFMFETAVASTSSQTWRHQDALPGVRQTPSYGSLPPVPAWFPPVEDLRENGVAPPPNVPSPMSFPLANEYHHRSRHIDALLGTGWTQTYPRYSRAPAGRGEGSSNSQESPSVSPGKRSRTETNPQASGSSSHTKRQRGSMPGQSGSTGLETDEDVRAFVDNEWVPWALGAGAAGRYSDEDGSLGQGEGLESVAANKNSEEGDWPDLEEADRYEEKHPGAG